MAVELRTATPADRERLVLLIEEFCALEGYARTPEHVAAGLDPLLAGPALGWVVVVEVDDVIQGYAVVTWGWGLESGGREALLDEIYVATRGEGLGTLLFRRTVELAREAGAKVFFLETEAVNARAREFYAREGLVADDSIYMDIAL